MESNYVTRLIVFGIDMVIISGPPVIGPLLIGPLLIGPLLILPQIDCSSHVFPVGVSGAHPAPDTPLSQKLWAR